MKAFFSRLFLGLLYVVGKTLYITAGLIALLIGILLFRAALGRTAYTSGVIISCSYAGTTKCSPTVRFETADHKQIEFHGSQTGQAYYKGRQVNVAYNPAHPSDAYVYDLFPFNEFLLPLAVCGIGLAYSVRVGKNLLQSAFSSGKRGSSQNQFG